MNWPVMMWKDAFYHRDLTVPPPTAEKPPVGRETRQDQCPLDVWQALAANVQAVIAGYGEAVRLYAQVVAQATPRSVDEARFHRDCVELGRCFHVLGRHTCLAQIARREGRTVDAPLLIEAIGNLARIVELSDRLGTFEYRRDWYVEAIANMRREVRRRGTVPP
jgi:hypothetical protein